MSVTQNPTYQSFRYPAPVDPSQVATLQASVIAATSATLALTAAQSNSLIVLDRAAGVTVTLPAPSAGLEYDFIVKTSVTSNGYKIITDAGTTFLSGGVVDVDTDSTNAVAVFTADGTTIISVNMTAAGTNAKGGLVGTQLHFACYSGTEWNVTGIVMAAGTVTTPFATS
jgi:redox-sensitive bicupin YhaK (pirin superfamily)